MKHDLSDAELFAVMCEDEAPKAQRAQEPKAYGAHGAETQMAMSWDSLFPIIVKLLTALRLPFVSPSLVTLREKIEASGWPGFIKKPLLAAIDLLISDPDLFAAQAALAKG